MFRGMHVLASSSSTCSERKHCYSKRKLNTAIQ